MQTLWHTKTKEQVISELNSNENKGLNSQEAKKRLHLHGLNILYAKKKKSYFLMFLDQFKSPLVYLLIFAAIITFFMSHYIDTWVISIIVIFNSLIGWAQEVKAEKSLEAIKKLIALKSIVLRDGEEKEIDSEQITIGDIVIINTGSKIPADLRLIKTENLQIDESILTGESTTVNKNTDALKDNTLLTDRKNMAYASTVATTGKGIGIVIATGQKTQIGSIAKEISQTEEEKTPLNQKIDRFSKVLLYIILFVCFVIFLFGVFRGEGVIAMFMVAVAAAVSAIPEGLPAIVTITLAIGVYRMSKRNAIVRKMQAVETLGSISIIASDKTGTLTLNQMFLEKIYLADTQINVSGEGYDPVGEFESIDKKHIDNNNLKQLLETGLLCNDALLIKKEGSWRIQGDPTEGSLVVAAAKIKLYKQELLNHYKKIDEIPFSSDYKYMATLHLHKNQKIICVKGSIEKVLEMSSSFIKNGKKIKLNQKQKQIIIDQSIKEANDAYRILAIAQKQDFKGEKIDDKKINELTYLGFVCLKDPPKKDALDAIKKCKLSGIKPIMITGDHPLTALAIAKKLEIAKDEKDLISQTEIEKMSQKEFEEKIPQYFVFARITPQMKLKIVNTFQNKNNIVAVTGDGVNDAPVLKKADVGIAMGIGGTDVAREASDIILLDNNFKTIVAAIEEGRKIFLNIRRVVFYLIATNAGELLILISALIFGMPFLLIPVQILWINLVTDTPGAVCLALVPRHKQIHESKPRSPKEEILNKTAIFRILLIALVMTIGTILIFKYELNSGETLNKARSIAFVTMALFQIFNVINSQSLTTSIFKSNVFKNKYLIWSLIASISLTIVTVHTSFFRNIFQTEALNIYEWLTIIALSSTIFIVVEIDKAIRNYYK